MTQNQELTILADVMVKMRDEVKLATDIYLPCDSRQQNGQQKSWPVLMERTPYNKRGLNRAERSLAEPDARTRTSIAKEFAQKGYVVVMQDCRGRYASEGSFSKYLSEAEDGYDTMVWLMEQPWCNGKIGTFGVSYGAHTQMAAACLNPPGLAAIFLDSGGFSSAYHGGIRRGGAFELKQVTWAHKHALLSPETKCNPEREAALRSVNIEDWFKNMPWRPGHSPLSAAPEYEDYLFEQWRQGEYSDYWKQLGISALNHYGHIPDIPVMIMNSWYDPYVGTSITNYRGLRDKNKQSIYLTMGPWTHGQRSVSHAGDVDFGDGAVFENHFDMSYVEYRSAWFDQALKGKSSPLFDERKPISLFVMGGGSGDANGEGRLTQGGAWQLFSDWPVAGTEPEALYFHKGGELRAQYPASNEDGLSYTYNPRQPTPTIGGAVTSGEPLMFGGAFDQREKNGQFGCGTESRDLRERSDVLSFETAALDTDVAVIGDVKAVLWISSDCVDTDFTVKLLDIHPSSPSYPDGFAMNICDGILRVRYRNQGGDSELMRPGTIYKIEVDLPATGNLFKKGHRIRVDIASSSFPQFDFNPNTGEPEGAWEDVISAKNTVYVDAEHPSHILLPLMKES